MHHMSLTECFSSRSLLKMISSSRDAGPFAAVGRSVHDADLRSIGTNEEDKKHASTAQTAGTVDMVYRKAQCH